jgi:hypothetical protein
VQRFFAFYKQVLVLKNKYPAIELATYSETNLDLLKDYIAFFDNRKDCYAPADVQVFRLGMNARTMLLERQSREHAQAMLDAATLKLQFDVFQHVKTKLSKSIFPGLKARIIDNKEVANEDEVLKRLNEIEGEWVKQKKYARFSAFELDGMMERWIKLQAYRGIIKQDRESDSPLSDRVWEELDELNNELKHLLDVTGRELMEAMLGRLALVPGEQRVAIAFPPLDKMKRVPSTQIFDENVLEATLSALADVGLNSDFAENFKRQAIAHSSLTPRFVVRFKEYIEKYGDESQRRHLDDLFLYPKKQSIWQKKNFAIPFVLGSKGMGESLDQRAQALSHQQQRLLTTQFTVSRLLKIIHLYDEANLGQLSQLSKYVDWPNTGLDFEYWDPREASLEFSSQLEKPVVEIVEEPRSTVPSNREKVIEVLGEGLSTLTQYVLGNYKQSNRHNRKGRAEHLVEQLGVAFTDLQLMVDEEEAFYQDTCCGVITFLFIHYQSIEDWDSELSKDIERSLVALLDAFTMEVESMIGGYQQALAMRAASQTKSNYLERAAKFMLHFFPVEPAPTAKEKDSVFSFLLSWIIHHSPEVTAALFEKTLTGGQEQYTYHAEVSQLLASLRERDGQETKVIIIKEVTKEDFDADVARTRFLCTGPCV